MKRFEDLNLVVLDFLSDGIMESVKIYEIAAVKIRNGKLHSTDAHSCVRTAATRTSLNTNADPSHLFSESHMRI